jgi:hypothetical protein
MFCLLFLMLKTCASLLYAKHEKKTGLLLQEDPAKGISRPQISRFRGESTDLIHHALPATVTTVWIHKLTTFP